MSSRKSEQVKKLERQVRELQGSLDRKETQIQHALDTKSDKEAKLEAQIREAKEQVEAVRESIETETIKIQELQAALAEKEAQERERQYSPGRKRSVYEEEKQELIDAVAAVAIGDRERNLQTMLDKARADKEKALRVLVKIAGKGRIANFLALHAGSPDLMDLLEEELLGAQQR